MTTYPTYSSQDCPRAWEAMPWVLQHSASPEQASWLQQHLAQCASCRAEFAQQTRLQRAMSLPSDIQVDEEAGLQRLLGRLDAPAAQEEPLRARRGNWLTRALVAAVLLQALGIGALGVKLLSTGEHASYRTLSQESMPTAPGAIRVVPDASMTLADWNALLHSLQLQVVGGPNDVGAYTVAPPAGSALAARNALQQLRAARGVRLAEPVNDTP
jgi:anti-sigma factor RsiW